MRALSRISQGLFTATGVIALVLLAITMWVGLQSLWYFRHIMPHVSTWIMLLLPNSLWVFLWSATAAISFTRWRPFRLWLAAFSPLILWQGLQALRARVDLLVPIGPIVALTRLQGALELLLTGLALVGLVVWWLERREPPAAKE